MTKNLPNDWFRPADAEADPDRAARRGIAPGQDEGKETGASAIEDDRATGSLPAVSMHTTGSIPVVRLTARHGARPHPRRRTAWTSVLILALALAVGLGAGTLLSHRGTTSGPSPRPTASREQALPTASASGRASAPGPWAGQVKPVRATAVTSDCAEPSPVDQPIMKTNFKDVKRVANFRPQNVNDDEPWTAWACAKGEGRSLFFTLPAGTTLTGVGLVSGNLWPAYADPTDNLFDAGRKISRVRWSVQGIGGFTQELNPDDQRLQEVLIPPVEVRSKVTLTIEQTKAPNYFDNFPAEWDYTATAQVVLLTRA